MTEGEKAPKSPIANKILENIRNYKNSNTNKSYKGQKILVKTDTLNYNDIKDEIIQNSQNKFMISTVSEDSKVYIFAAFRGSCQFTSKHGEEFGKPLATYWDNLKFICSQGKILDNHKFKPKWQFDETPYGKRASDAINMTNEEALEELSLLEYKTYLKVKNLLQKDN